VKFHRSVQPFSNQILLASPFKRLGIKMFGLIDHVKTARHRARALAIRGGAEVSAYLPQKSVDLGSFDVLPQGTKAKLEHITELARAHEFDTVAELLETTYQQARQASPGVYEFEVLAYPFLASLEADLPPHEAERVVAVMADWADASPDSVYASGCYALACLQAGFAHRGTSWAEDVEDDGWEKLSSYCERARLELDRTEARHGKHWFWCKADLHLAIHDMTGRRNHWARFERAILTAPGSSDLYSVFAHQLMPRWHGSYKQLGQLCEHALTQDDTMTGLHNYVEILATLLPAEGDACHRLFQPAPLNVLAQHYALRENDGDRTFAANLYAWADNFPNVLSTMEKIETFHTQRWLCANSLEYTIAYALVGLPSDERKRA
jgi:hypothetical protein